MSNFEVNEAIHVEEIEALEVLHAAHECALLDEINEYRKEALSLEADIRKLKAEIDLMACR